MELYPYLIKCIKYLLYAKNFFFLTCRFLFFIWYIPLVDMIGIKPAPGDHKWNFKEVSAIPCGSNDWIGTLSLNNTKGTEGVQERSLLVRGKSVPIKTLDLAPLKIVFDHYYDLYSAKINSKETVWRVRKDLEKNESK